MPLRRQAERAQVTAQHQKDLHDHTRLIAQPVHHVGHERRRVIGHRSIEGEMVEHDELRADDLEKVDQREPLRIACAYFSTLSACARSAIRSSTPSSPTENRTSTPGHEG